MGVRVIVGGMDVALGWAVCEAVAVGVERATVSWGMVGTEVLVGFVGFGEQDVINNKTGTMKTAILRNFMADSWVEWIRASGLYHREARFLLIIHQ